MTSCFTSPSPSILIVNGYFFFIKFAVTSLFLSIVITMVFAFPDASPDQLSRTYSSEGVATTYAVSPSPYSINSGTTWPPSAGSAVAVNV